MEPLSTFLAGAGLGLGLIVAIGAQNAFVLRQGVARSHVGLVVAVCALSDMVLIGAGVAGFGTVMQMAPWLERVLSLGGGLFLLVYGGRAILSGLRGEGALRAEGAGLGSARAVLVTALLLTWGNPHVYLDTLVLLGAVSTGYENRLAFFLGAATASTLFFTALGYGARLLAPVFRRPRAWQVLDLLIGAIMWWIAVPLILG